MNTVRYLIVTLLVICFSVTASDKNSVDVSAKIERTPIELEYPEVYELANIILALTDYGLEDPMQVQKDFAYYKVMREWFDPYRNHPVIKAANFSQERWQEYLSFRTDAYAFIFDEQDRLVRTSEFTAFEVTAFDEHLEAVEDFARESKFREFFELHKEYRAQVIERYKQSYMLEEMRDYLIAEFGEKIGSRRYVVALSPFVYAQNLHRDIDNTLTVDFPSLAKSVIKNQDMSREEQARSIHTLFTEMDHGYVNPTTDEHEHAVKEAFDPMIWAGSSGYEEYSNGVFNEYMTWAVYDLFIAQTFPEYAAQMSFDWHVTNESRGFRYSHFFAEQLMELYAEREDGETLRDLYPLIIKRMNNYQRKLSKPVIANARDVYSTEAEASNWIELEFSEPMTASSAISYSIKHAGHADVNGTLKSEDIRWSDDRMSVKLKLAFDESTTPNHGVMFNNYGTSEAFKSALGVTLAANSYRLVQAKERQ